jgi:hypothetical protein
MGDGHHRSRVGDRAHHRRGNPVSALARPCSTRRSPPSSGSKSTKANTR